MPCKDHNVILAAFKFYNVEQKHFETLFLPFTFNELKLDSEIRNIESYILLSARPLENHNYKIYDTVGIKLLNRLRLNFSKLKQRKFGHSFTDTINPFVNVMFLFP